MSEPARDIHSQPSGARPFRVLVVDDSAIIRGFISRWLDQENDIAVVGTAANGQMALKALKSVDAELVILDIEMPVMDGMEALPELIRMDPDVRVIMASTLTRRGADISLRALRSGASDYIPKPESARDSQASDAFRKELISKIRALGIARRQKRREALPESKDITLPPQVRSVSLRKASAYRPSIIAIGASTGGPQALCKFFADIRHFLTVPVLVTQHMPKTFTPILAEHIARAAQKPAAEAEDGEILKTGHIYVAPGGWHMGIEARGGGHIIRLNQEAPEHFCRPSVNPLFRTVSDCFGRRALAVMLTGMGSDGREGAEEIVENGGTLIAQDKQSSVVWGMPGTVAEAGLCAAVLPLGDLGPTIGRLVMGGQL